MEVVRLFMNFWRRASALFFMSLAVSAAVVAAGGTSGAADAPFVGTANWGGTGLMEIPTARVMQEGHYRFGAAQVDPYRYYYGAVSPLRGLEIDGRVTEILGVDASSQPGWSGYGNYRDKALGLKYQFTPESKWLPALAIGIMDPQGTRLYPAQYVVASKQIYPFDFTIGFGNGRFGEKPLPASGEGLEVEMFTDPGSWRRDGQFFWGVEIAATDNLRLMVEYSPIRYEIQTADPAQAKYFQEAVPSKFNFGIRWRPLEWLETVVSWQRGEQIGINLSANFDLGTPMIPIYDQPYRERPEFRLDPAEQRIARGLGAVGFGSIAVRRDGDSLRIEAQNNRYYFSPHALEIMLRTVTPFVPADVRVLRLMLTNNGIPVVGITVLREDAALFAAEEITTKDLLKLNRDSAQLLKEDNWALSLFNLELTESLPVRRQPGDYWDYGINPAFRMFLNDPSGFFKYRLGVRGWVSLMPWRGASVVTGLEAYPFNTVSTSNAPAAEAVRTDIVSYQENNIVLGILMGQQIEKFPQGIYGRLSAGLLEVQYGGLDAEVAKPLLGGRLMVGLSGSLVKKRDPDQVLGFKENDYKDIYKMAFVNTRLNLPEFEAAIDLKTGQFLAGDRGTRLTLSKFFSGLVLSAWYSWTDTDFFTDPYNRGYHDKGISVSIPLRFFTGKDSKTVYHLGISPWTRDVAQDIDHFTPLFDYIGRDTNLHLLKDALR
jgi:hypothetical protein